MIILFLTLRRLQKRVCQNSLFNKITPATHSCSRGDFHILDVLTHLLFFFLFQLFTFDVKIYTEWAIIILTL